jgi:hypothetical protein
MNHTSVQWYENAKKNQECKRKKDFVPTFYMPLNRTHPHVATEILVLYAENDA